MLLSALLIVKNLLIYHQRLCWKIPNIKPYGTANSFLENIIIILLVKKQMATGRKAHMSCHWWKKLASEKRIVGALCGLKMVPKDWS